MVEREKLVALVQAVQRGDDGAAGELYQTFYQDIYYYIFKTVNDRELAEDLTQDTFMEILETVGRLNEPAAFVTWSRQIAYHRCTAHFRKRKELLADEDEDGYSVFDTVEEERAEFIPDAALDQEDLKQTIHNMIAQLPEEQRSALMMRYFDEFSVAQIAQIQGVSEGTVKSRLNYGRKAVKQSVETFEKKNGIKLHSIGVLPVLLWLFRQNKLAAGVSLTRGVSGFAASVAADAAVDAATDVAVGTATDAAAETAASGLGKLAVKAGKSAAKSLGMKIVAGAAAAAVVGGGAAVVANLPEEEPEEPIMQWVGYGEVFSYSKRRFDLTVEKMNKRTISGTLTVSYMYETGYESAFEGEATESEDGQILYAITFEEDYVEGLLEYHYNETELVYDEDRDTFIFDDYYDATLDRVEEDSELLLKEGSWSGLGSDSLYVRSDGHQFRLTAEDIRENSIKGTLNVSFEGNVDQDTGFTGRGYHQNGKYIYEILLDNPRYYDMIGASGAVDRLWLVYDKNADTMEILGGHMYHAFMRREK